MMIIKNLEELERFCVAIAKDSKVGDVYLLEGDLGVGKTTFCQFFINYFFPDQKVVSPTFCLVEHYDFIAHYDLYRIEHIDELLELGIEEDFYQKICLIEWGERLGALKPKNAKTIKIILNPDETRKLFLTNS